MSDLSEKVRNALYAKLNVSAVTDLATDGVFYGESTAPDSYKGLIFEKVSNLPFYTFGLTLDREDSLWAIKTFTDDASHSTKSGIEFGQDILIEAENAVGQSLSLSSGQTWAVYRERDLPLVKQPLSDRSVWMQGFLLRVVATNESGVTPPPDTPSYARTRVIDETPSGLINGSNATFTTAQSFLPASVEITLNGIALRKGAGNDYITVGTDTIIFATSPEAGDIILVDYEVN